MLKEYFNTGEAQYGDLINQSRKWVKAQILIGGLKNNFPKLKNGEDGLDLGISSLAASYSLVLKKNGDLFWFDSRYGFSDRKEDSLAPEKFYLDEGVLRGIEVAISKVSQERLTEELKKQKPNAITLMFSSIQRKVAGL